MMRLVSRAVVLSAFAAAGFAGAAGAQTATPIPTPTPAAAPTAIAFSAHAHANLTVVAQGTTYTGSVQFALAQRTDLTRVDVLSVKSDAFPLPPLRATVVIDRRANTLTIWSDATKQYRVQPFLPRLGASPSPSPRASARPTPTPGPARRVTSPFAGLEVLDVSLKMTGHTTTAGVPTTGLAFDLQVRKKGDQAASHVAATTQLADEFAIFPMTLDVSLEPGAVPFSAKLAYAVDDLTRGLPPLTTFRVPAGYKQASSIFSVIFPPGTNVVPPAIRPPSPQPSPSP
jgi:hypothetical protein